MSRDTPPRAALFPSEGASRLLALTQETSFYAVAKQLAEATGTQIGVGQLSRYAYAIRRPTPEWVTRIQDEFGIPADLWGREPFKPATRVRARAFASVPRATKSRSQSARV